MLVYGSLLFKFSWYVWSSVNQSGRFRWECPTTGTVAWRLSNSVHSKSTVGMHFGSSTETIVFSSQSLLAVFLIWITLSIHLLWLAIDLWCVDGICLWTCSRQSFIWEALVWDTYTQGRVAVHQGGSSRESNIQAQCKFPFYWFVACVIHILLTFYDLQLRQL